MAESPGTWGRPVRFAAVGLASTVLYLVLYLLLRQVTGPQPANLVALLLSALANTALNRRVTFERRGRTTAWVHTQGLVVFVVGLALTSLALVVLRAVDDDPSRFLEAAVLLVATAGATVVRYLLFSRWVFSDDPGSADVA